MRDLNVLPPPQRNTVSPLVYPRVLEAVPQCWNQLPREPEWETFRWMSELCLFKHSHEPIPLREATTRIIYHRLRDNIRSTPNCYDAWRQHHSASSLTDSSWKLLWKIPIDCAVNPFQRDCLWKLMHRVLPTQDKRLLCHLTASDICPACGVCRDSLQHAFNSCQLWRATVNFSTALLVQMSITLPRTTYCPLHLFLLSSRPCVRDYFAILYSHFLLEQERESTC